MHSASTRQTARYLAKCSINSGTLHSFKELLPSGQGDLNQYNFGLAVDRAFGNNKQLTQRYFEAWMWLERNCSERRGLATARDNDSS